MSDIANLKPKMRKRGMFHMKHITVELGTKYEEILGTANRHRFIGYLYEVCNLSNGERTLTQIERILSHELWPMDLNVLAEMVRDMERLDYMDVNGEGA